MFNDAKRKLKIFISSAINEFIDLRHYLEFLLKETGLVQSVYVFETTGARSCKTREAYLSDVVESDLVILLVNNDTDISGPTRNEYELAKKNGIRILCFFLKPKKEDPDCSFMEELKGENGIKFNIANSMFDMASSVYNSFIEDLLFEYRPRVQNYQIQVLEGSKSFNVLKHDKDYLNAIIENSNKEWLKELYSSENHNTSIDYFFKSLIFEEEFSVEEFDKVRDYLKPLYSEELKDIILKRLKIISSYFSTSINDTRAELTQLANEIKNKKEIPNWIKNDIYIDLRNIEIETNNWVDGVGQSYIDKNDESVYYPELDRISSNIYEKINENIKNGFFKAPLTISFRNYSMQFEDIKKYFYIALYYGSLTHLRIMNQLYSALLESIYLSGNNDIQVISKLLKSKLFFQPKDIKSILRKIPFQSNVLRFIDYNDIYSSIEFINNKNKAFSTKLKFIEYFGEYIPDILFENFLSIFKKKCAKDNYKFDINNLTDSISIISKYSARFDIEFVCDFLIGITNNQELDFSRTKNIILNMNYKDLQKNEKLANKLKECILKTLEKNNAASNGSVLECALIFYLNTDKKFDEIKNCIEENYKSFYNKSFRLEIEESSEYINDYLNDLCLSIEKRFDEKLQGLNTLDEKSNVSLLKNIILMTKNDISNEIYNKVLDLCKLIFENYNVKNSEKIDCLLICLFILKYKKELLSEDEMIQYCLHINLNFEPIEYTLDISSDVLKLLIDYVQILLNNNLGLSNFINKVLAITNETKSVQILDNLDQILKITLPNSDFCNQLHGMFYSLINRSEKNIQELSLYGLILTSNMDNSDLTNEIINNVYIGKHNNLKKIIIKNYNKLDGISKENCKKNIDNDDYYLKVDFNGS